MAHIWHRMGVVLLVWGGFSAGCQLAEISTDKLVVGMHQPAGVVNPLGAGNRSSLAAQQLQLPALVEFLGRNHADARLHNRYRRALIDTAPGSLQWNARRQGQVVARLVLRHQEWFDPRTQESHPLSAVDVVATLQRIKQADRAMWMSRQQGRLEMTPFLSFVSQAIESAQVDSDDPHVLYLRFADHILGPNRLHALTFRVLPAHLLNTLANDRDVFVSATPYRWDNWAQISDASLPGAAKPPDAVLRFKSTLPERYIPLIELRTTQDLRSYKNKLESGAFGLAFGLPQKPGNGLKLPQDMAWQAYESSDLWAFVVNCQKVSRQDRRALVAVLSQPESRARFVELLTQSYPEARADMMRRSIFPNRVIDRFPRVREAVEEQARSLRMPLAAAAQRLEGRRFRFIYSYGMGDQFEPDAIAHTVSGLLGEVGAQLTDQRLEFRDFMDELRSGETFELALYKFSAAAQLPEDFDLAQILPMKEERGPDGGYRVQPAAGNIFHFADGPLYESMLQLRRFPSENEQGELDHQQLQRRQAALVRIDRIVRQEAIGLFLFSPTYYWFWQRQYDIAFDEVKVIGGEKFPAYSQ
ncbi:MAG: hypothetical protein GKR89_15855 [Candidatus Latescibacteria bacterium]|nr:hypothetical protein [Candidatus Latescibacterota bacterium]